MADNDNSPKIPYSRTNDEKQDEVGVVKIDYWIILK